MSTDRELLELAAKTAGLNVVIKDIPHRTLFFGKETVCRIDDNPCKEWNPFEDDGDALRLAVKLNMNLCLSNTECLATIGRSVKETVQSFDGSATRRAIVRAAAEIGRNMKGETE